MIALKEFDYKDIDILREKYNINLDLNLKHPIFTYVFYDDQSIIGYSQIQIYEKKLELIKFICDETEASIRLFFLKSTGFKGEQMGFDSFSDKQEYFPEFNKHIVFDELFKGSCHD